MTIKVASLQEKLKSRNESDLGSISELNDISTELDQLESSEQVYDIVTNGSGVPDGAGGVTTYNTGNDHVVVNIGSEYNAGHAAHEFKHAFQFDSGAISFDSSGERGGALYDTVDEFESYVRSSLFGHDVEMHSLSDVGKAYKSIKDRNKQITLNTRTATFDGALTHGQQLKGQASRLGAKGLPPKHYFKSWRKSYMQGAFSGFLKRL